MTKYSDPKHPLWKFLNLILLLIAFAICSYTQASNFDETELKALGLFAIVTGGGMAVKQYLETKGGTT